VTAQISPAPLFQRGEMVISTFRKSVRVKRKETDTE
jgi:hypothetical protein